MQPRCTGEIAFFGIVPMQVPTLDATPPTGQLLSRLQASLSLYGHYQLACFEKLQYRIESIIGSSAMVVAITLTELGEQVPLDACGVRVHNSAGM